MWRAGLAILWILGFAETGIPMGLADVASSQWGVNGSLETAERIYEYGYSRELSTGDYDGALRVLERETGEVLHTLIYETGYWETFLFMGAFSDGTFVLATARYIPPEGSGMIGKHDTRLVKIDENGEILLEKSLPEIQEDFHNHGGRLIVRTSRASTEMTVYDESLEISGLPEIPMTITGTFSYPFIGIATVNGEETPSIDLSGPGIYAVSIVHGTYTFSFSIQIEGSVSGIEAKGEYDRPVRPEAFGELILDGEVFSTGTEVAVPGHHRLVIQGAGGYERILDFTIHPKVENLEPGGKYAEAVPIFSNGTGMWLDGEPIENGSLAWRAGDHLLEVGGLNGYRMEVPFSVLPSVTGVTDGGVYVESVEIRVNGGSSLDGMILQAGTISIADPGEHELILWDEDRPIQTIRFTIKTEETTEAEASTTTMYPYWETGLGIVVLVGLFLVLKKK